MLVGYHVIFGAYGFWLPNDPRGSWSDFVGSWKLLRYGPATRIIGATIGGALRHDSGVRLAAKNSLRRPAAAFNGLQARAVGQGFGRYVARSGLTVWACAILPDHVHLVLGKPAISVEQVVVQLKGAATRSLLDDGLHPFGNTRDRQGRPPKCFARGEWKVFLDPPDVPRAIRYVEQNPIKEGKPPQGWSFVIPRGPG